MRLQTFVHAAVFCYGIKKILWSSDLQITTLQCPQWWEGATAPLSGCGVFLMETPISCHFLKLCRSTRTPADSLQTLLATLPPPSEERVLLKWEQWGQ